MFSGAIASLIWALYRPDPKAEMTKSHLSVVIWSGSSSHRPLSSCSVLKNFIPPTRPFLMITSCGERKGTNSHFSCLASSASSGTALMLMKPFLKTTKTLLAPHLRAEVAQSKAVSPAPRTITVPCSSGSWDLQAHIPGNINQSEH